MNTMFGAPAGDFCHGLLHPDLMGPNRSGPKGFRDLPIGIDGLYLGGAGCRGGPGITFIPDYNAGNGYSTTSAEALEADLRATPAWPPRTFQEFAKRRARLFGCHRHLPKE
jgi:phytoene dehydrogenase-like protein